MADLSPSAQAVLDAVVDGAMPPFHVIARPMAAAALRALADQVVPFDTNLRQNKIRAEICAIAAELEGKQ